MNLFIKKEILFSVISELRKVLDLRFTKLTAPAKIFEQKKSPNMINHQTHAIKVEQSPLFKNLGGQVH